MIDSATGAHGAEHESLTCPLCAGSGEIARREVLRLAGVDGVLDAIGPRIVQLVDERGLSTLGLAKDLVETSLRREAAAAVTTAQQAIGAQHESARLALERELERARTLASKAHERSEKLASDFALANRELTEAKEELTRLRNTASKKGEAGEADFVEALKPFKHIRVGQKESSAGDYIISVAVDEAGVGMRFLDSIALVDVKKDKIVGPGDARKLASDARSKGLSIAFLVAATTRSKNPVDDVIQIDGVLIVTTTLEDFVAKVALLTPFMALQARLRAEAGSTVDARQRLGELADRVVAKLKDLEAVVKQTRAIQKAVMSIDAAIAKAKQEIVALCAEATARQAPAGEGAP